MPNINCSNLNEEKVIALSQATCAKLAQVIGCPIDWINYMVKNETIIIESEKNNDICFIEVDWFKRSDEIRDEVVNIFDEELRKLDYHEIVIYFNELDNDNYYENKQKFDL